MKIKAENYLKRIDWAFFHVFLYLVTIVFFRRCTVRVHNCCWWLDKGGQLAREAVKSLGVSLIINLCLHQF